MRSIRRITIRPGLWALVLTLLTSSALLAGPKSSSQKGTESKNPPETPAETQSNEWPKLSDEEMTQAVDELKNFADEVSQKLNRPLQKFETKYFLFYSDLTPQESAKWAGLLDRMYANLSQTFGVKKGENIWRGKALVFVFSKAEDYKSYEAKMMKTDSTGTDGMCHSFPDGTVKIAFYRQPDELEFAHVLVHENVHGFIHRFRTPERVPSWANEGLAETIATDLVPQKGHRELVKQYAREGLQQHGSSMGNMCEADHIAGWQYPVAQTLCEFMIVNGRKNYVNFIIGIKEGLSWQDSLEQRFKVPLDRLVAVYGNSIGVKNLKP